MKKILFTITLLINFSAFAQIEYDVTRSEVKGRVSVNGLRCVIGAGTGPMEDRAYLELTPLGTRNQQIELDHDRATSPVCDLAAVDRILDKADMHFGFFIAHLSITKKLERGSRIFNGKCVRLFKEEVSLDLGEGVIVKTSERSELRPAQGCQ